MQSAINFFKETREELDKIVWPSREQTIRYTILVILVTVASGLILGGLDYALTYLSTYLVQNYGQ